MPWLARQLAAFAGCGEARLQNASETIGAVAVQGPRVVEFIDRCFPGPSTGGTGVARVTGLKKNQIASFSYAGDRIWVSRTGYTGEDGFEVVAPGHLIEAVWNQLLSAGQAHGLKPAGLGARDTLRTEVCYPLYGHELDENTTPIEAGLGFFVALDKGEFIGRAGPRRAEGQRPGQEARGVQDDGPFGPAASALRNLEHGFRRGEDRRSDQRHAESVAGQWASGWATCRRDLRQPALPSRSKSAASAPQPSWSRSRSIENRIDRSASSLTQWAYG